MLSHGATINPADNKTKEMRERNRSHLGRRGGSCIHSGGHSTAYRLGHNASRAHKAGPVDQCCDTVGDTAEPEVSTVGGTRTLVIKYEDILPKVPPIRSRYAWLMGFLSQRPALP